jgi:hypothetical protein
MSAGLALLCERPQFLRVSGKLDLIRVRGHPDPRDNHFGHALGGA